MQRPPDDEALAESQGISDIRVATFNIGCSQPVKKTTLLSQVKKQMDELLHGNSIVCLQEAQGVYEILEQIADARGWESISTCHEGVTTFYNPAVFDLVEDSVQRIWPEDSAPNAEWRRLVCSTFRPRSDSDDHQLLGLFVVCNNHT